MSINIQETFQKMPLGEKIIIPAAVLLLIDSFLPWYHASVSLGVLGSVSISRSGWQSPGALWSILAMVLGLVMAAVIVVSRFTTMKMPALPAGVTWARVQLGLGVAAAVFVLLKIVNESSSMSYGFFIGIICVAALVVGGGLLFQTEREGAPGGGTTGSTM
jgi:hypothetical protein